MTTHKRFAPGPEFGDLAFGPGFGGPRHGIGPGFGGPRHGFGPPFGGGRGRGRRRRGDVRFALLRALQDESQNGYQLMQAIEERSGGRWRPSPGSVYPALSQLEDQGFIHSVEQDGQKVYEITEEGRAHLTESGDRPAPWEEEEEDEGRSELRSLVRQIHLAAVQVSQAANDGQLRRANEVLTETRRSLYRILAEEETDTAPAEEEADSTS